MVRRILLVEDNETQARLLREYLENTGKFLVTIEGDGIRAVERIADEQPDGVILDVGLPGLDGYGVCKKVRETYFRPIVMLTARGTDMEQIAGFQSGADDYIPKPCSAELLVARLENLFEKRQSLSEQTASNIARNPKLTSREAEVVSLAIKGFSRLNIARTLNISENTVQTHIKRVYRKLGVSNRAELSYAVLAKDKTNKQ